MSPKYDYFKPHFIIFHNLKCGLKCYSLYFFNDGTNNFAILRRKIQSKILDIFLAKRPITRENKQDTFVVSNKYDREFNLSNKFYNYKRVYD